MTFQAVQKTGDNIRLYHTDHLGSTALVTDLDGEVTQHVAYIPYGEIFVEQRNGSWNTPYLFNAKELDEETGLYYYGARYLDPTGTRWLSVDPLFEKYVGMTPYGYCAGNPVKLVDPTGESTKVAQNEDGTYTVIGGDLNDKDRHIYVYSKDKDGNYTIKGSSIGISLTTTSFWDADNNDWAKGTIINPNDKSGINFMNKLMQDKVPTLDEYMRKAGNDGEYDFKWTNGTKKADHTLNKYRGMPIGGNNDGEVMFTSARDVGNFVAGYIAAINGMSWDASRLAFDFYQSYKSKEPEIEGITTRNAEYKGWITGYNRNPYYKVNTLKKSINHFIESFFK